MLMKKRVCRERWKGEWEGVSLKRRLILEWKINHSSNDEQRLRELRNLCYQEVRKRLESLSECPGRLNI